MFKSFLFILTFLLLSSCASQKKDEGKIKQFTKAEIEKYLVVKKSTKADVIKALGSPEMINSLSDKSEQWVYSKSSLDYEGQRGSIGAGVVSFVSSSIVGFDLGHSSTKASLNSQSKTLEVSFNSKGILKDYSFSHSKI